MGRKCHGSWGQLNETEKITKADFPLREMTDDHTLDPLSERGGLASRVKTVVLGSSFIWIFTALLGLIAVFGLITPSGTFISTFNLQAILSDSPVLLIMSAAAMIVIVGGGIDLSLGSVVTFCAVTGMLTMQHAGVQRGWLAICVGIAVAIAAGIGWGIVNGTLVAYARVPAFVVTLGSLGAALGAARLLADGQAPSGGPPEFQEAIGLGTLFRFVPITFVVAVCVVVVCGCVLAFSRFGEHVYLMGSNMEAARRGGIRVERTQVAVYGLAGFLGALAGLVDIARFDSAGINTGHTTELIIAIAAVIIGGASLNGGVGTMAGTVVGVFIPIVLNNGLVIAGVSSFWQDIAVGVILVLAVWFDTRQRERDFAMSAPKHS